MAMKEQVIQMCKDLRLPSIRKLVNEETSFKHPEQAIKILHQVLVQEKEDRFIRAKQNRIRAANFPQKKLLEELSLKALPPQAQQKIPILKQLDFIKEGQKIIVTGSSGTGKTHAAIGIGIEAGLAGYQVFFGTVTSLINQLKECMSDRTVR